MRAVHDAGMHVLGFDTDDRKIAMLGRGETYLAHLGRDLAATLAASDRFRATGDPADLAAADVIVLCVPTPLDANREPDLRYVRDSTRMVAGHLRPGQLVVLESTTYPDTTRGVMLPILESGGLVCGRDFFLAYSPEREDPGRPGVTTSMIPKLVGGVDEISGELAFLFCGQVVREPHLVSRAEVAEAAKLLENIYRAVNIALVNELKVILDEMGIDVWEVIAAASTKPFGYQPFYPGPGLGGHCIPIDPFYLAWKAKQIGRDAQFITLAGEVNAAMPAYVVMRATVALAQEGTALADARVLVLGIAYKPNVDDIRESPAAEIITQLRDAGATVAYHDPHIRTFPKMRRYDIDLASIELTEAAIREHDCVIIVTDHAAVDYALVGRAARLIVDTRNVMAAVPDVRARVVKA